MNTLQGIKKQLTKLRQQKQSIITQLQNRLKKQEQMTKKLTDKLAQQKDKQLSYKISELDNLGYIYRPSTNSNLNGNRQPDQDNKKYLLIDISTLSQHDDFVTNNQINFVRKKQLESLIQSSTQNQHHTPDQSLLPKIQAQNNQILNREINSLRLIVSHLRIQMNDLKKRYQQNSEYNKMNTNRNGTQKGKNTLIKPETLSTPQILLKQSQFGDSSKDQSRSQHKSYGLSIAQITSQTIKQEDNMIQKKLGNIVDNLTKRQSLPSSINHHQQSFTKQKKIKTGKSEDNNHIAQQQKQSQSGLTGSETQIVTKIADINQQKAPPKNANTYRQRVRSSKQPSPQPLVQTQQNEQYGDLRRVKNGKKDEKREQSQLKLTTFLQLNDSNKTQKIMNAPLRQYIDEIIVNHLIIGNKQPQKQTNINQQPIKQIQLSKQNQKQNKTVQGSQKQQIKQVKQQQKEDKIQNENKQQDNAIQQQKIITDQSKPLEQIIPCQQKKPSINIQQHKQIHQWPNNIHSQPQQQTKLQSQHKTPIADSSLQLKLGKISSKQQSITHNINNNFNNMLNQLKTANNMKEQPPNLQQNTIHRQQPQIQPITTKPVQTHTPTVPQSQANTQTQIQMQSQSGKLSQMSHISQIQQTQKSKSNSSIKQINKLLDQSSVKPPQNAIHAGNTQKQSNPLPDHTNNVQNQSNRSKQAIPLQLIRNSQQISQSSILSKSSQNSSIPTSAITTNTEQQPTSRIHIQNNIQSQPQAQSQQQPPSIHTKNTQQSDINKSIEQKQATNIQVIKTQNKIQKQQVSSNSKQHQHTKINPHKKKHQSKVDKKTSGDMNWASLFASGQSSSKKTNKQKQKPKDIHKMQQKQIKKFSLIAQQPQQIRQKKQEQEPASDMTSTNTVAVKNPISTLPQIQAKQQIKKQQPIIITHQTQNKTQINNQIPIDQKINFKNVSTSVNHEQNNNKQPIEDKIQAIQIQNTNINVNPNINTSTSTNLTVQSPPQPNKQKQQHTIIKQQQTPPITSQTTTQQQNTLQQQSLNKNQLEDTPKQNTIPIPKTQRKQEKSQQKIKKQKSKQKNKQTASKKSKQQQLNWGSLFSYGGSNSKSNKKNEKSDKKNDKTKKQAQKVKEGQKQIQRQVAPKQVQANKQKQNQANTDKAQQINIQSPNKKTTKQQTDLFMTPPRNQQKLLNKDPLSEQNSLRQTPTWNLISPKQKQGQKEQNQIKKLQIYKQQLNNVLPIQLNHQQQQQQIKKVLSEQEIRAQKQRERKKAQQQQQKYFDDLLQQMLINQNAPKLISFNQGTPQNTPTKQKIDTNDPLTPIQSNPNRVQNKHNTQQEANRDKNEDNSQNQNNFINNQIKSLFNFGGNSNNNTPQKNYNKTSSQIIEKGQNLQKQTLNKQGSQDQQSQKKNQSIQSPDKVQKNPLKSSRKISQQLKLPKDMLMKNHSIQPQDHIDLGSSTPQTPYPPAIQQIQAFRKNSSFMKKASRNQNLRKAQSFANDKKPQPEKIDKQQPQSQKKIQQEPVQTMKKRNQSPIYVHLQGSSQSPTVSPHRSPHRNYGPLNLKKNQSQNENFLMISGDLSDKSDKNTVHIAPMNIQQLQKIESKVQTQQQQNLQKKQPNQQNDISINKQKQLDKPLESILNPVTSNPQMNNQLKPQTQDSKQNEIKFNQKVPNEKQSNHQTHKSTDKKKKSKVIFLRK